VTFSIDTTELRTLAADFRDSAAGGDKRVTGIIREHAERVRDVMAQDAKASPSFDYSDDMSFEMLSDFEAEIGAEKGKGKRGSLAHLGVWGGANGGGGKIRDPQEALDEVAPDCESALADVLEQIVLP
jgi:hypothetical protein